MRSDEPMSTRRPFGPSGRPNEKIRECSRNSPTIEHTEMVSESSGIPGRRQHRPRTARRIGTPARDAA